MKKQILISIFILFLGATTLHAQNSKFTIHGEIKGMTSGSLFFGYTDNHEKYLKKTIPVEHGKFKLEGMISEPTNVFLCLDSTINRMDDPNLTNFWIEATDMHLEITLGAFKQFKLSGSKTNDEEQELNRQQAPIREEMQPLTEAYMAEKDHEKAAAIREQFEPYNERMEVITDEFIRTHTDSYLSPYLMRFRLMSLPVDQVESAYNHWTERVKNSRSGKEIAEEIKKLKQGSPGSPAIMFNRKDINDKMFNFEELKGKKYVILYFWASWCVPCRKGNPHLKALHEKYAPLGLEIVCIASDDSSPDRWRQAVEQDGIGHFHHVLSGMKHTATGYDKSEDIGEWYGIHTLPTKILIDKNGNIIARYGGGGEPHENLDQKLIEIFGK